MNKGPILMTGLFLILGVSFRPVTAQFPLKIPRIKVEQPKTEQPRSPDSRSVGKGDTESFSRIQQIGGKTLELHGLAWGQSQCFLRRKACAIRKGHSSYVRRGS